MIIGGDLISSNGTAGGSSPITVTAVHFVTDTSLAWVFSSDVTVTNPLSGDTSFEADDGFGFTDPTVLTQFSSNTIIMTYVPLGIGFNSGGGDAWRIPTQPSNVNEAASITVPQNGTTIP